MGGAQHPIIITGCRRSGTTLLCAIFDQHPDLIVHPQEPQFLLSGYKRFGATFKKREALLTYITGHRYCPASVTSAKLDSRIPRLYPIPYREVAVAYLNVWMGGSISNPRPVLKDPAFVFSLPIIQSWFPGLRVIHMIREPKANVSSQRARWPRTSITECAFLWKNAVRAGQAWGRENQGKYYEFSYEGLAQYPGKHLAALCNFLEIPYSDELLTFNQVETQYSPGGYAHQTHYSRIDPSRLEIWRKHLSSTDIRIIESIARKVVEESDYSRVSQMSFSISYFVRRALEWVGYNFLRFGRWNLKHFRKIRFLVNIGV